jgi:beta-lactamase superfamily II metal-dependent hydrolase
MAEFEIIFMDAGQGDCTLIGYPDGSLTLIDCGSTKSGSAALVEIKKVIDRKFKAKEFISVVLTHPDEDHYNLLRTLDLESYLDKGDAGFVVYYGGDIELYRNKKDSNYTYNLLTYLQDGGAAGSPDNTTYTEKDGGLSRAGVDVTILAANCTGDPTSTDGPRKNTNSIVLLVEFMGSKIFLMGDAFVQTEQFIMAAYKKANALNRLRKQPGEHVILKMGHHGSETSTSKEWVQLLQPDIIVVSAGTKTFNGTGMPKETHLNATINATTIVPDTGINQTYVVYDTTLLPQVFADRPATKRGVWTTCHHVAWDAKANGYYEEGQTWYYGVDVVGKKRIPNNWYGYTGYEDT